MTCRADGCARPWVADIGFVGRAAGAYSVYVGGNSEGARLNTLFANLFTQAQLARLAEQGREQEAAVAVRS